MKQIVTGGQMKLLDSYTIEKMGIPSLVLMERAALSVCQALREEEFPLEKVLVLCGTGNNGADGVAVARMLHAAGVSVDICILGKKDHYTEEMRKQVDIAENYHISFVKNAVPVEYTTIVDAVFGVGLSREVGGVYRDTIEALNRSDAKVMAVDIPSGISADTGKVLGCAVKADVTVTFAYEKAGLLFYPGASYARKIKTADIGIYMPPQNDFELSIQSCEDKDLFRIPVRKPDGNKGTFGKVLLFAGSKGMAGAAVLSALAVLHSGAGMVRILSGEENRQILQTCVPEAMLSVYDDTPEGQRKALLEALSWADVVAAGPGLGTQEAAHRILTWMLEEIRSPLILDADAINILARDEELLQALCLRQRQQERHIGLVLTPHPGELSRLSGLAIDEALQDPFAVCAKWAERLGAVCLCKGARTVVAEPAGTFYVNTSGNSGMATAGSGDVLTGILAALLAQGMKPFEAACAGVYLHGCAGDAAAAQKNAYSLVARDLILGLDGLMK